MAKGEYLQTLGRISNVVKAAKQEAQHNLDKSIADFQKELAELHFQQLWMLRGIEKEVDSVAVPEAPVVPTYVMGSLFLGQCKSLLTRDEKEFMFYVTGMEDDGVIYLTTLLTFECSERSVGGVHGDDESVFQAVMAMQGAGHRLYGWFHSHPGSLAACSPSATDIGMQGRLESLGYPAIGGIFTRDGYIRFFSVERRFGIQIHGQGVEDVDAETFLYQINLPD